MASIQRILWFGLYLLGLLPIIIHSVDPKFDPSTRMRLVLVPADAGVGTVIYRLRATDEEFDFPLTFELVGSNNPGDNNPVGGGPGPGPGTGAGIGTGAAASTTVQIESLPCTKYNSVCQANVILQRRLEPGRYYDFQVSVKDTKGGMATQLCSITATNFTTPHDVIFPHKPGIIMIPEDAKRGTELDYVITRKNPLSPKPVYLELWGSPLFAIRQKIVSGETTEGTIYLLGPLDFEKQAMFHLTVLANDAYAEPEQDSRNIAGLEVVVIVQDVQDQPPVFTMAPPVTKLPTGLLPGDKVLQVHAEDGDKGSPREIRYGLVSEGNPFTSFFDINDTSGEIFLMRPLDEIAAITHIGDPVLLTVIAEEVKVTRDEPPAMASTVQLAFFLPERSNSPPYFENDHYVTRVDENAPQGTALTFIDPYVPRVYDDDTGKNGVFSLTLLNNNGTFEITPNVAERSASFLIRVRDNSYLDYEERQSVEFQIMAQELGPSTNLSATINVTVYLNDINDNAPIFTEPVYTIELPENMTVGTKVIQIHADDIDTGMGGRIRYTQILGYLNTSLNLDAATGLITVSTNNHGFDRETMPEYHLYVEARDNDGTGNRAQVPLIIKMIDVNDETPIFEKSVYEFILANNLRGFTTPALIKATDKDATAPNNEIRYEIINGNYDNKFIIHKSTGELSVRDQIVLRSTIQTTLHRQRRQISSNTNLNDDIFVLTARAYDLGVPVRFSMTTIRIYPPESRTRIVTFVVPGYNPDRKKTEETLSAITGGQVIIHEVRPLGPDEPGAKNLGGDIKERSVVTATVLYDSESVVDISHIQQRLSQHNSSFAIMTKEDSSAETLYKAENKLLFWLLILLAVLVALTILILLLCCICSWCPLYNATSKRVINVGNTEDDVHLVHREMAINGKQTKSVQVAEWMGRREAWSAEKSADSRTKPTRWEFTRRNNYNESMRDNQIIINQEDDRRVRSADEHHRRIKIKNRFKDTNAAKEQQHFHNSRTNLINDRDIYIEDVDEQNHEKLYKNQLKATSKHHNIEERHIDDDSMRRHEIDRGSDIGYGGGRASIKRTTTNDHIGNRELFIKDGNTEILQLMTRGKTDDENIYVNLPTKSTNITQPHLIMVDNSGKEILMRRFIEEQPDGKQIIREHYQIVPGATTTYIQAMPNEVQTLTNLQEVYTAKSGPNSVVYSQLEPEVKVIHTQPIQTIEGESHRSMINHDGEIISQMQQAHSSQSLHQELETSLKQQNALLRQILMEKEKLEERYNQQEVALETQSLPCHSMAIATQTDRTAGTQTTDLDEVNDGDNDYYQQNHNNQQQHQQNHLSLKMRRRARSENDDSMSEDEYEYVRYSPPNSPDGVYWIKRKRTRRKSKGRSTSEDRTARKRVVMVEQVKRNIRTPIKEENEDLEYRRRTPPIKSQRETKTSILRRMKNEATNKSKKSNNKLAKSPPLNKDILMEISDSLDDASPQESRKHNIRVKEVEYYGNSEEESDADEIVIRRNTYSADSIDGHSEGEPPRFEIHVTDNNGRHKIFSRQGSSDNRDPDDSSNYHKKVRSTKSVPVTPAIQPRLSRKDNDNRDSLRRRQTTSEPPNRQIKNPAPKPPNSDPKKSKKLQDNRIYQSEADLIVTVEREEALESTKSVPKYMEWYYGKKKNSIERNENIRAPEKTNKSKINPNKKLVSGSEKRINKTRQNKNDESNHLENTKFKPEPLPRKSPPRNGRMLKEDVILNKNLKPKIETDSNHPLLQYSEHRFEHDYDPGPEIPLAPTKLPHYMYPETPPSFNNSEQQHKRNNKDNKPTPKPKPSPIKENEVKVSRSKTTVYIEDSNANHSNNNSQNSKQLNVSTLEDDHDSGIAMNSLLNSMGRRNPIAEKKSVFTIAYDDVSRVQKIQSGSDSPQFS